VDKDELLIWSIKSILWRTHCHNIYGQDKYSRRQHTCH